MVQFLALGGYRWEEHTRTVMEKSYVEQRDGGYWITGTRISLDSIVYAFKRGAAPESIQRALPLLTLEEIYGAITFYLAHAPGPRDDPPMTVRFQAGADLNAEIVAGVLRRG